MKNFLAVALIDIIIIFFSYTSVLKSKFKQKQNYRLSVRETVYKTFGIQNNCFLFLVTNNLYGYFSVEPLLHMETYYKKNTRSVEL